MRFGIMATGGVGGYFGAMLARGGKDVAFIARGAHLEALRKDGLRVESVTRPEISPREKECSRIPLWKQACAMSFSTA